MEHSQATFTVYTGIFKKFYEVSMPRLVDRAGKQIVQSNSPKEFEKLAKDYQAQF